MRILIVLLIVTLAGCAKLPEGIVPIQDFDINRYLGKWYEIARLDHSFERGLQQVTADYSLRENGGIKVINRGFDEEAKAWDEAEGKAYFVEDSDIGFLKVSFFGPFYGAYVIFDIGENYEYALVTSNTRSYLWLLSRTPTISEELKTELLKKMSALGFDTQALIFVEQDEG